MFKGRQLVIATKHEKETVIAPILEKELGVNCFVPANLDTDQLGTFTGEIDRTDDPITAARKKCEMAMAITNSTLAVANEGSFGAHPSIFFVPADEEIIVFIDKVNDLEIIVKEVSTETNFKSKAVQTQKELIEFADSINFPSHRIILRSKSHPEEIVKGSNNLEELIVAFNFLKKNSDAVIIETDMRACFNPTRMKVIKTATEKLIEKIRSCCPKCNTPGFAVVSAKQGLRCELCNSPTRSTLSYLYKCSKCNHSSEQMYPHNKMHEEPLFCDFCNP